ncbi:MAG: tRNA preQ1(34) S-adenosylmethionine ribosyltransferase-isomerase QueA [Christensenellaceae bacterium]|nr:tRNA preQ1(34) S-adenosylmethionine ribosyltransferase-isomerase QueA [Christensenellaceae bacterium]
MYKTSDFDYYLPEDLIAQRPIEPRDNSRLLVYNRANKNIADKHFYNIIDHLNEGDVIVINETKVIPARLLGEKEDTGVPVEILLLKRHDTYTWEAIVHPGRRLKPGAVCSFGDGRLKAQIIKTLPDGGRLVKFAFEGIFEEVLDALGQMPLPPYIHEKLQDKNRYQTVYAKYDGSAAAPTAGLHFTPELLERIKAKGIKVAPVLLHVGLGTFRPMKTENIAEHVMHSEFCEVSKASADLINDTRANGGRCVCVGTTSVRTVESCAVEGKVVPQSLDTSIFISPGYRFEVVDALITNFHLPKSTLLMLVSALMGRDEALKTYEHAVAEKYRFFSFGDAMMIE